jgi:hypothetical protein
MDLKQDEEVIQAFLNSHLYFFISEHKTIISKHPNHPRMVASVLDKLPLSNLSIRNLVHDFIKELLPSDRNVALAWVRAGGRKVPDNWMDDDEIIEERLKQRPRNSFELPDHLKRDKAFMLKAIRSNVAFITRVDDSLSKDWDLLLNAMADMEFFIKDLLDCYDYGDLGGRAVKQAQAKLTTRKNFLLVLSVIQASAKNHHLALTMLGQGQETTQAYVRAIEDFLGVPSEEDCQWFQRALKNLNAMGYR